MGLEAVGYSVDGCPPPGVWGEKGTRKRPEHTIGPRGDVGKNDLGTSALQPATGGATDDHR